MNPYFEFLFILFFIFCYIILILFFFCNGGRWSLDKPSSLISVVLVWGLCSVVLGKPLSVFSGRCLHNPVHTPILSLYRETINKKNESIQHLSLISTVCVRLTQESVHEYVCVCNYSHLLLFPALTCEHLLLIIIMTLFSYIFMF